MARTQTTTVQLKPVRIVNPSTSGGVSGGNLSAAALSALEATASGFYSNLSSLPPTTAPNFGITNFANAAGQSIISADSAEGVERECITVEAKAAGLGVVFKHHANLRELEDQANIKHVESGKELTLARIAAGAEIAKTAMAAAHEIKVQEVSQRGVLELAAQKAALGRIGGE